MAANALVMALDRGGFFTLTLSCWLLVKLTCTQFREQTYFFDGALKAPHCSLKGLVFFDSNDWHKKMFLNVKKVESVIMSKPWKQSKQRCMF